MKFWYYIDLAILSFPTSRFVCSIYLDVKSQVYFYDLQSFHCYWYFCFLLLALFLLFGMGVKINFMNTCKLQTRILVDIILRVHDSM